MRRVLKAWFLLLLLGLVLPWGGSPLRYCPCFQVMLVAADEGCPCDHTADTGPSCCGEDSLPLHPPTCLLPIKLLPDAIAQSGQPLPGPVMVMLAPAVFALPPPPLGELAATPPPCDRGPPFSGLPPYLRYCSLLL